ncbi:MAG: hypothetical protein GC161_16550 [Planctomycetaceae bacterium]|nr:hypothetical protein [Planctomycetaceae bacterium]
MRHVAATRRKEYLGHNSLRNAHGQRERHETGDWLAATSHLFGGTLLSRNMRSTPAHWTAPAS